MSSTTFTLTLGRHPMLWMTAMIAVGIYWDPVALRGPFIYDDVASINNNPVVKAEVPWTEAFTRDFWGTPMSEPASHKSYRPITTLTLRLNYIWAVLSGAAGTNDGTFLFHAVNVILHGINTGLVTEVAAIVFDDGSLLPPIVCGILFGIHPVHAEAVSNITSRGEMLMTLFFLLAFLPYANNIPKNSAMKEVVDDQPKETKGENRKVKGTKNNNNKKGNTNAVRVQRMGVIRAFQYITCVYVLPCVFMSFSLFSKEQGATTLCTLVAFDFLQNHYSVRFFVSKLKEGDSYSWAFLRRTLILAIQTLALIWIRWMLNGASSPDFVYEQNPPGFTEDRFSRVFTVSWVYCLYLRDMVFPAYLAPDWSGNAIDIILSMSDYRAWLVVLLWIFAGVVAYSLVASVPNERSRKQMREARRIVLTASIAFTFLPFLLSSNLLVTTGLAKADRVIYLPLFGYCLVEGLLVKLVQDNTNGDDVYRLLTYILLLVQFILFGLKVHERNLAWSNGYTLWTRAYQTNPKSFHTISNAGHMLSKNNEWKKAEEVLRPIKDVRTNNGNPNDTFLYAVALANLERCNEAFPLIDDAIKYLQEEREKAGLRYDQRMSLHSEASLIVARGFCTDDIFEKGRIILSATQIDPNNDFAQHQFMNYMMKMFSVQAQMQSQFQQQQHQMPEGQKVQMQQQMMMAQEYIQKMQQEMSEKQKQQLQQQLMQLQNQAQQYMQPQAPGFHGPGQQNMNMQGDYATSQAKKEEMQRQMMMQPQQQGMAGSGNMPRQQNLPDLDGIEDMFFN